MEPVLLAVTNVTAALLFGGMVAFAGFFAPMAFARLPEEQSGPFIQGIFPYYYSAGALLSGIGAIAAVTIRQPEAIMLWIVALGFVFSRYYLMPKTVATREARERGDAGAAERFADLHKRAAFLNMMQLVCCFIVLVRMAA